MVTASLWGIRIFTNHALEPVVWSCRIFRRLAVFNVDINLGMMCLEHVTRNHYVSQNSLKAYRLVKLFL